MIFGLSMSPSSDPIYLRSMTSLVVLFTLLLFILVFRAQNMGFYHIWNQHIAFVPWFGEWPQGIYPSAYPGYPNMTGYPNMYYPQVPGQALVVPGAMPPGVIPPTMI
jgi:hypothetical protein